MDKGHKDLVILKNQQMQAQDLKNEIKDYSKDVNRRNERLQKLNEELDDLFKELNIEDNSYSPKVKKPELKVVTFKDEYEYTYDELFQKSKGDLEKRGIDIYNLGYEDLLQKDVIEEIERELNRPLPRREKWNKDDMIIVFVAALVGSIADFIFGNRTNKLTGSGMKAKITEKGWEFQKCNNSDFSEWLNKFHKHPEGSAMDYQGPNFGGGNHRVLSKGHDLFRMIETINNIKNGRFEGITYRNGVAERIVMRTNQYGTPYETMSTIEAIGNYFKHMKGDFFSTNSLPIPGYSFFMESSNRDLRIFAANMYKAGFNMKNVAIQAISTLSVELILRIYMAIKETKRMKMENESLNILEDYSNIDNIKSIVMPASNPKYREMFLVAHSLVTALNIGKVIIKKSPWEINLTEITATVRYLIPYIKDVLYRHSKQAILDRNNEEIINGWDTLLQTIDGGKLDIPMPKKQLIIV